MVLVWFVSSFGITLKSIMKSDHLSDRTVSDFSCHLSPSHYGNFSDCFDDTEIYKSLALGLVCNLITCLPVRA